MNWMIRMGWVGTPVLALLLIAGCSSHQVKASSGPRPPTRADDVKIYQKAPHQYERLGTVTVPVTPEVRWDQRGESRVGFDRLKAQAAALGANGVLLVVTDGSSDLTATAGYHGTFYQVPMRAQPRAALAEAIYVLKE